MYLRNQHLPPISNRLFFLVQRTTRRLSISSESDTEMSTDDAPRRKKSPAGLKRKPHHPSSSSPPPKRKKPVEPSPADDPTRKYCLGKFEELSRDIFLRYPHVRIEKEGGADSTEPHVANIAQNSQTDLAEDEKTKLLDRAQQFAADLESCVYETYSEPDKHGRPSAGPKYKYVTNFECSIAVAVANLPPHTGIVSECFSLI